MLGNPVKLTTMSNCKEADIVNTIVINNISKEFKVGLGSKRVQAISNLSLEIQEGEVFGFLGPNGAGKSTTIKMLLNLLYPDSGSISILGNDVKKNESRTRVGYLPEQPYFYDYLTAEEILWYCGKLSGLTDTILTSRSETVLHKVNLQASRKRPLRTYSKGMLQRVGLALALVHDPDVVILDEPMSGLDPLGRKMVGDLILELKSRGKTVFFSSHILTDVEHFCDRIGILVDGKLIFIESLKTLLSGPATLETIFLREVKRAGGGIET